MAFQPCPETAEIRIVGSLHGQTVENVLHCRVSTTPTLTDLEAIRDVVNTWVTGPYAARLSNSLTWVSLTITDLNVEGGIQVVKDMTTEGGGESPNDVKTNQDTLCLKIETGHAGRNFRGRFYVMALPQNQYDTANTINAATASAWVADLDALRIDLDIAGFPMGVLSRQSKTVNPTPPHLRPTGLLTDATTVSITDLNIDSQRRRLPGRGI